MDVYEYFQSRERECNELSLVPDGGFVDMFAEEVGSYGQRGMVFGRLILSDRAFLEIHEMVVVEGTGIHRERYSYYLIIDGYEAWGYDRAPDHDPPDHMHIGPDHKRHTSGSVSFKEIAGKAWETLSQEESLEDTMPMRADDEEEPATS